MRMSRADIRVEQMNFVGALADYQKAIEAFETQIQGLTASIAALETRSGSRAGAAEKRRHEREKATAELALAAVRRAKSSIEQVVPGR